MKVRTSDGNLENFDSKKIANALLKDEEFRKLIFNNQSENLEMSHYVTIINNVMDSLTKSCYAEEIISSDTIRGFVVTELIKFGYKDLSNISEIVGLRIADIYGIIKGDGDNDNANLTPNPETSHKILADTLSKKYYLRMFPEEIAKAHISGDIHIHDLEYFGTRPFCRSWDLRRFFLDGFSADGEDNSITAKAPKHAEVAILQATKILAMGQCNHAGGQGLLYGTVFLAPYMKGKSYKEIKQLMQMMLYELNQMYISRGGQVIFSSINISPGCPKVLEDVPVVFAGKIWDGKPTGEFDSLKKITYKEYEREIRLQFRALMELSLEGDSTGKLFPFPKLEVAIERKFIDPKNWDESIDGKEITLSYKQLYRLAFEVTAKTGILYFDNLLPESKNAEEGVGCTQCCSYSFKTDKDIDQDFEKELNMENGYFFRLGGMQAVSINLPRLAYKSNHNDKKIMANIFDMMDIAVKVFQEKKRMIEQNKHRLKFLTQKGKQTIELTDFNKLVYEVGIVGLNELIQYHKNIQIHERAEAIKFGKFILSEMNKYCKCLSELHGLKIVLARTPAETTAQRFAVCDLRNDEYTENAIKVIKGDLDYVIRNTIDTSKNLPIYYSNGFAPYVGADINILERIQLENAFWPFVDGGAITHIFLGEDNPDPDGLMDFAMNIFKNTQIGYIAFTKNLTQCIKCKNIMGGIKYKCSKCGSEDLNVMSRITGYYSEVFNIRDGKIKHVRWNNAKVQELKDRKMINI